MDSGFIIILIVIKIFFWIAYFSIRAAVRNGKIKEAVEETRSTITTTVNLKRVQRKRV
jgi:hypothetical protein